LLGPTDLLRQELGLVIKEFVQGDEVSHACLPDWGSDGRRKIPHRCGDEVFLIDPTQVAGGLF
jgi:hypothetical protein